MKYSKHLSVAIVLLASMIWINACKRADTCSPISNPTTRTLSANSVILKWPGSGAPAYTVQYRVTGATAWQTLASNADSLQLTNLEYNKSYEWQVKSICGSLSSEFSPLAAFTTVGCDPGYEGVDCRTESINKFLGTYSVQDTGRGGINGTFAFAYTMIIERFGSSASEIKMTNFSGFGSQESVKANISGINFVIPPYVIDSYAISNVSGTLRGSNIEFRYTLTHPRSGIETYHATGLKQ